jgi:hypothetical protein
LPDELVIEDPRKSAAATWAWISRSDLSPHKQRLSELQDENGLDARRRHFGLEADGYRLSESGNSGDETPESRPPILRRADRGLRHEAIPRLPMLEFVEAC